LKPTAATTIDNSMFATYFIAAATAAAGRLGDCTNYAFLDL